MHTHTSFFDDYNIFFLLFKLLFIFSSKEGVIGGTKRWSAFCSKGWFTISSKGGSSSGSKGWFMNPISRWFIPSSSNNPQATDIQSFMGILRWFKFSSQGVSKG